MGFERGSFRKGNRDVYDQNLKTHNKEWLENYKYKPTKDNKTVFTSTVSFDDKHYVIPNVIYKEGRLQELGDRYAWDNHKYGIPFDNFEDAENFSLWLSNLHQSKQLQKQLVKMNEK